MEDKRTRIGELSEKSVHHFLKYMINPDESFHEVKVDRFFVDVKVGEQIYEIQSRQFEKMKNKISKLLINYKVCVVYPIYENKTIVTIDEVKSSSRLSPKHGNELDVFLELYKIKDLLTNDNLSLKLVMMDIEETRTRNNRVIKKLDKKPVRVKKVIDIKDVFDYSAFLEGLSDGFNSKEYAQKHHASLRHAQITLSVLTSLELITRKKFGREYIYTLN